MTSSVTAGTNCRTRNYSKRLFWTTQVKLADFDEIASRTALINAFLLLEKSIAVEGKQTCVCCTCIGLNNSKAYRYLDYMAA